MINVADYNALLLHLLILRFDYCLLFMFCNLLFKIKPATFGIKPENLKQVCIYFLIQKQMDYQKIGKPR